jgi:hypothetical protein
VLDRKLNLSLWALRIGFCVLSIASGVSRLLAPGLLNRAAGCVELAAGILVLTPYTWLAATFLSGWLVVVALKVLLVGGAGDSALSDLLLAAGAFALARFTRVNETEPEDENAGHRSSGSSRP